VAIEVEGIGVVRNTIAPKANLNSTYRFKAPRKNLTLAVTRAVLGCAAADS
jgi:hypothetical protein